MSIKPTRLYSGTLGYKVVDDTTNKTVYISESKVDCEQVMFALRKVNIDKIKR